MTVRVPVAQQAPSFSAEGLFSKFSHLLGPFLSEVGISEEALTNPDILVPLDKHCRLLELAAQRHRNDCIGLDIGKRVHPRDMGPLGYTILNSPDVRSALENFARYLRVYARGCEMSLHCRDGVASFDYRYTFADPSILERRQEAECTLAMLKSVIEIATGERWQLKGVWFEHPKPSSVCKHEQWFQAPVHFDRSVNSIKFDPRFLERRITHAEPRLYALLEEHLEQVISHIAEEDDLPARVGSLVASSLSGGLPSIDHIAKKLCMTKRTLQRRLAQRGILYNEYADEIRRKLALQYVEKTHLPLTEIAFLLGYSHLSAFSRAFRRWTSRSPAESRHGVGAVPD